MRVLTMPSFGTSFVSFFHTMSPLKGWPLEPAVVVQEYRSVRVNAPVAPRWVLKDSIHELTDASATYGSALKAVDAASMSAAPSAVCTSTSLLYTAMESPSLAKYSLVSVNQSLT